MGPAQVPQAQAPRQHTEELQATIDKALQEGWIIRRDPVRLEFTAAREMVTARTLEELLAALGLTV
jgi:hypothetical protein